ncbi:unnamed protein product [Acanthoscelides obtectus]|uniref:Uncharacterized protein n=1 Tax=Acanthoscelides obtectus TaxID=200917 RepID=A0A9P0P6U3_ACAOB|nr:unnamed protein product [Acanthoscelides obtectus]CAK1626743.1 hypothetical protein AOBTE_LOCUS4054 [Acanthoscelides obtectus]
MITFKVSFLLSFTLRPQTVAGKKKEKKGDKNKEKPAKKESKKKKVTVKDDDKESLVIVFGPQDVLGVAHVDYDLVPGYFDMMVYRDVMTVPEIHFPPGGKKIKSLVPESVYLEQGTTMHIEAYILAPQTPCLVIHNQPNLFKRMLMVIYDEQLAKDVFVEIYTRNKLILHEAKKKSEQNIDMELSEVLTGFLIDNGNNYLMFVEGLMNGFFVEVFHLVDKCNLKVAKIFCNYEHAFEKRLYQDFIFTGIYPIILKIPLHDILAIGGIYVRGSVPKPCMEALKKLDILLQSRDSKSIHQYNLLPKPEELISFNLEWGVSMRWKEEKQLFDVNFLF